MVIPAKRDPRNERLNYSNPDDSSDDDILPGNNENKSTLGTFTNSTILTKGMSDSLTLIISQRYN